ncbi:hypothetical protein TNIN_328411 [Trichonephila inaurata madagascariensis]|uniref:Uncharacterized protein n=1 Tax=Trichonephila inaurata madagascariensis TaxID=2747483 RepID=A0A8X7CGF9_9ARAC|nr:hypothetical protein TNIN_328411 [Trichonephila inaurata madagascariensis]
MMHVGAEPIYQAGMQRRDTLSRNTGKNTLETASPTPQGVVSLYGIRRGVAPHGSVPPAQSTSIYDFYLEEKVKVEASYSIW